MVKSKRQRGPSCFLIAHPHGNSVLQAKPEVPDVAEQIRGVIAGKLAEQYTVTAIIVGGKYWRSLVAVVSGRIGRLLIPPAFDTVPIIAVDGDVIEAVYGNVESLQFSLSHLTRR